MLIEHDTLEELDEVHEMLDGQGLQNYDRVSMRNGQKRRLGHHCCKAVVSVK